MKKYKVDDIIEEIKRGNFTHVNMKGYLEAYNMLTTLSDEIRYLRRLIDNLKVAAKLNSKLKAEEEIEFIQNITERQELQLKLDVANNVMSRQMNLLKAIKKSLGAKKYNKINQKFIDQEQEESNSLNTRKK